MTEEKKSEEEEKKEETIRVWLDVTSNSLQIPGIRKQTEANLEKNFKKELPNIMKRMENIFPFITTEIGFYSKLLDEAKLCYRFGLYYATITMISITAERFSIELSEKMNFKINENSISEKDLFNGLIKRQDRMLALLKKAKIIKSEIYDKLMEIRRIRTKYIHPREEKNPEEDSLKVLKLFIEIIQSRFSDNYTIKDGKIVKRMV